MKQLLLIIMFVFVIAHFQSNSVAQNEPGRKAADFRAMDYNQIINTNAIQQLAKENAELKTITKSLQKQIDDLKKAIFTRTIQQ